MRTLLILLLLAATGLPLSGCNKKFTHFYVDYTTNVTVPATLSSALPIWLPTPKIGTNSTWEFENRNTRKDKVQSIFLKQLKLTITAPEAETFSFADGVSLYISSDDLPEVLVASRNAISDTIGNELSLTPEDTDLQAYIKATTFKLRLKIVTDETIPQDVDIKVYSNFLVNAKLIRSKK